MQDELDNVALPSSLDAEREVLASVLVKPTETLDAPEVVALRPEDFYAQRHQLIFKAMREVNERDGTVDPVTLTQQLKDSKAWERVGGLDTLRGLLDRSGLSVNVPHYARTVLRLSQRRAIVECARDVERQGMQANPDNEDVAALADKLKDATLDHRLAGEAAVDSSGADAAFDDWLLHAPPLEHGRQVVSDLPCLQALFEGDVPGLHFIGARSGGGKSVLIDNHVALPTAMAGGRVACFHLEMPAWKVHARRLAKLSSVSFTGMVKFRDQRRRGLPADALTPAQADRVWAARQTLRELDGRMVIDDTSGLTADDIAARMRLAAARMGGLELVVIDHLHYMRHPSSRSGAEHAEQNETIQRLTDVAKAQGVVMVIAAQLRKDRGGSPSIGDFYAANRIEWNALTASVLWEPDNAPLYGNVQQRRFQVLKNRDGGAGRAWLAPELQFSRFAEVG